MTFPGITNNAESHTVATVTAIPYDPSLDNDTDSKSTNLPSTTSLRGAVTIVSEDFVMKKIL